MAMRIAVIGAGGVGGAFGAALAKAGADVTFLARGAHLAAMRRHGLALLSPRGDLQLNPVNATDEPGSIGQVDVVLFCVKLWDVESAGAAIRPLVGSSTAVIRCRTASTLATGWYRFSAKTLSWGEWPRSAPRLPSRV
jgi:2-dehydropantoate 2-reductase